MRWEKLGRLHETEGKLDWMASHAANPHALVMDDGSVRVYFNTRDRESRAHIAMLTLQMEPTPVVSDISLEPVLRPGEPGYFDDSGVSLGSIVRDGDEVLLYYVGWNLAKTVPWRNSIGLAVSGSPASEFEKVGNAPVLDRSDVDPFSLSYPAVIKDGTGWRMYYGSNLSWGKEWGEMEHVIKLAGSDDGRHWQPTGKVVIGLDVEGEYAISRPSVLVDDDGYHMWYSHRGDAYRIGYSTSSDGVEWHRRDDVVGIDVSEDGWDSEMICYPQVFRYGDDWYMLYNGNGFGKTGFGIARRVD